MNRFVLMDEKDMVATALVDLMAGQIAQVVTTDNHPVGDYVSLEDIPYGNKIALVDIKSGDKVIKYGSVIGQATEDIKKGALVHVHNVKSLVVDIPPAFKLEIMRQMRVKESL